MGLVTLGSEAVVRNPIQRGSTIKTATLKLLALLAALTLLLAACAEEDAADEEPVDDDEVEDVEDDVDDDDVADGGEISIAWIPWEENIAVANMWAVILEEEGFDVALEQFDVAPAFAAVAGGDHDLFLDMWLPDTHATYLEEFGDDLETFGVWYEGATLELSVPSYVVDEFGIASLEDLAENPDVFDGQIVGIEAGAGMMELLREDVMPGYGLDDDFELVESSTAAMRADLQAATDAGEPVVVTLWSPHPEYGLKDLTRLEDPEGLWGEGEVIEAIGRVDFSEDFPQVASWMEAWFMDEEELASLNAAIDEADEADYADVAAAWVADNRDLVDSWLGR